MHFHSTGSGSLLPRRCPSQSTQRPTVVPNAPLHDGMPVSSSEMTVTNSSSGNTLVGLPLNGLGIGTLPNNPPPKVKQDMGAESRRPKGEGARAHARYLLRWHGRPVRWTMCEPRRFSLTISAAFLTNYIPEFQYRQIHVVP